MREIKGDCNVAVTVLVVYLIMRKEIKTINLKTIWYDFHFQGPWISINYFQIKMLDIDGTKQWQNC